MRTAKKQNIAGSKKIFTEDYVFSEHIFSGKIFEIIFCLAILAGTYSFTERWELRFDTTTTHANSEFYKLLRLPVSPILKIQKFPLGMLILSQKSF